MMNRPRGEQGAEEAHGDHSIRFPQHSSRVLWEIPVWTVDPAKAANHQGRLKVFRCVISFIASITPSFTPRPESLMPPKGLLSIR